MSLSNITTLITALLFAYLISATFHPANTQDTSLKEDIALSSEASTQSLD